MITDLNNVCMKGKLSNLEIIYQNEKESFYKGILTIKRDYSDNYDLIPITISGNLLKDIDIDSLVEIKGQLRSKDIINEIDGKLKLSIYIYVESIFNIVSTFYKNEINLDGYIVKRPNLRTTPNGKQIADLLIACNYGKDKTTYIPCIAWGRNARFASRLKIGDFIHIDGRLQSRNYNKIIDGISQERTTYELSINKIN